MNNRSLGTSERTCWGLKSSGLGPVSSELEVGVSDVIMNDTS